LSSKQELEEAVAAMKQMREELKELTEQAKGIIEQTEQAQVFYHSSVCALDRLSNCQDPSLIVLPVSVFLVFSLLPSAFFDIFVL
jgi:hypothetical protein